ncbi:glycerol uptake facilitator protein [Cutibacterium acnes JCM 18909]|nr:glycerol uptake facilitator protein [Cutibacterium acnes JCM 18909]
MGTLILILLGCGVVANNLLPKSKGHANAPGSLQINWGWGFGVMFGVYAAYKTGGHLNPAVTVGLAVAGKDLAPGIPATAGNITIYILAQFAGAFVGAVLCWLAYKQHYDEDCDPALKLGTFATGPEIRNPLWNTITEAIGTCPCAVGHPLRLHPGSENWPPGRRFAHCLHRCLPWWAHRICHQPGP